MKITTFNTQIITKDAQSKVEFFKTLGFEVRHQKDIQDVGVKGIRMKNPDGFYVDISQAEALPQGQDVTGIRINVDNFDEAYQLLLSRGFKNFYGDQKVESKHAVSAIMIAPSGFCINLVEHVKE